MAPAGTPWFLYLIECSNGSIYTGVTVDVAARYASHAAGRGARFTRANPPRRLLGVIEYSGRGEALRAEYRIRRLSAARKRSLARACPPGAALLAALGQSDGGCVSSV